MTTPEGPVDPVEKEPQYSEPEVPMRNGRPWGIREDLYEGLNRDMVSRENVDTVAEDLRGEIETAYEEGEAGLEEAKRINNILSEGFDGDLQVAWNTTTTNINEAQQNSISGLLHGQILHENQLRWSKWTKHVFDFRFTNESGQTINVGNEISTGMIDLKMNSVSGKGLTIVERPGWAGRYRIEITFTNDTSTARSGFLPEGRINATSNLYYGDSEIRYAALYVWPEWGSEPREYTLRSNGYGGFQFTNGYENRLEGNPIEFLSDGGIKFTNVDVVASEDVTTLFNAIITSGEVIEKNSLLKFPFDGSGNETADKDLVIFTEVQPEMQWEPGAPRSGSQSLNVAPQTLGSSLWRTVANWNGLDWLEPVAAKLVYEVRFIEHNMVSSSEYVTRILHNGQEVSRIGRNSLGGMNMYFAHDTTIQLGPGDRLDFQVYCSAGFSSERRVGSGGVQINWG